MTNILFVSTSPRGGDSLSGKVAQTLLTDLKAVHLNAAVVTRDLGAAPLPHLGPDLLGGFFAPEDQRTPEQTQAIATSDSLIAELKEADIVVIASAMINFTITSTLKSWFDHLARAGLTFRYNDEGKSEGLLTDKKVYLVLSTGGIYSAEPGSAIDFQAPYLKHMLGFMGLTDVEIVRVEGSLLGPDAPEKAVEAATAQAHAVAEQSAAA